VEARKEARRAAEAANALAATGSQGGREITDQIPVRPVGVVEGASYTVIIVAGVACAGAWHRGREERRVGVCECARKG
jgi:hypothetical protein